MPRFCYFISLYKENWSKFLDIYYLLGLFWCKRGGLTRGVLLYLKISIKNTMPVTCPNTTPSIQYFFTIYYNNFYHTLIILIIAINLQSIVSKSNGMCDTQFVFNEHCSHWNEYSVNDESQVKNYPVCLYRGPPLYEATPLHQRGVASRQGWKSIHLCLDLHY